MCCCPCCFGEDRAVIQYSGVSARCSCQMLLTDNKNLCGASLLNKPYLLTKKKFDVSNDVHTSVLCFWKWGKHNKCTVGSESLFKMILLRVCHKRHHQPNDSGSKLHVWNNTIFCMSPICLNYCIHSSWQVLHKFVQNLMIRVVPAWFCRLVMSQNPWPSQHLSAPISVQWRWGLWGNVHRPYSRGDCFPITSQSGSKITLLCSFHCLLTDQQLKRQWRAKNWVIKCYFFLNMPKSPSRFQLYTIFCEENDHNLSDPLCYLQLLTWNTAAWHQPSIWASHPERKNGGRHVNIVKWKSEILGLPWFSRSSCQAQTNLWSPCQLDCMLKHGDMPNTKIIGWFQRVNFTVVRLQLLFVMKKYYIQTNAKQRHFHKCVFSLSLNTSFHINVSLWSKCGSHNLMNIEKCNHQLVPYKPHYHYTILSATKVKEG